MASKTHAESSEEHRSTIVAYENNVDKSYDCPLCLGSGRIPHRMNDTAERSIASVDGQQSGQRRSEVRAIEILWARLDDEKKREFEHKREDEKRETIDAISALAQSIITESKGLGDAKERREAKIKKYVRVTASEDSELKDERKRASKEINKSMDVATLKENDDHKQKKLSDRMKEVEENAAELQRIRDEDQGLEERMNQIMETDGAESLEELEIMNKFYEHQINRLQKMNRRYRERKELGERMDRAVDIDAEGGKQPKDLQKSNDHRIEELGDGESNYMDPVESLADSKKETEDEKKEKN
ncbi:uncharacterized protein EAE97_007271 [Botrytis byssoidea]|uniref:Uncharacterized protein n=1 Tax=Botrytis byssoidea TaxID=139641 RepID=A0A9P5M540_9HELO|nr:uncharacterized protein EAE97_007271 [Botrytis byssoidea]KAF7939191.1 hypothetical protein EAE97_007271 [Botrytis byssoidea]